MTELFVRASQADIGLIEIRGRDRVDLLHRLSTADLRKMTEPGLSRWTVFTTNHGKIVDWCRVLTRPEETWIQTSAGRGERLREWVDRYTVMEDVITADRSADVAALIVSGAGALELVGLDPEPDRIVEQDGIVWGRGLAAYGERLEGIGPRATVDAQLADLVARGARTVGNEQREWERVAAGVPSPAVEFRDEVNPLELRLAAAISWDKGCYVGQEVIARLDTYDKVARALIGVVADQSVAPAGAERVSRDGKSLGRLTSWCPDPDGGGIGLAVVKREAACSGDAELEVGETRIPVRLEDRPFWTPD